MQTTEVVLDKEAAMETVGGDEALLHEIAVLFLDEYPALLDQIRCAVHTGDSHQLERSAHTLKGAVANFGARSATAAALELELAGRRGSWDDINSRLAKLESEFEMFEPALAELIAGKAS